MTSHDSEDWKKKDWCDITKKIVQCREFPADFDKCDYDTCLGSDGCVTKAKDCLIVNSKKFRRHDFPTKAHFQYVLRDKCLYEIRKGFVTCFSAKFSTKTFTGCPPECYLDRTRNLAFDYRYANGMFAVLDPETKLVFGFLMTNGALHAWYGRYPWCWKRFDKCYAADDDYFSSDDECDLKCKNKKGPQCCREDASDFCERKNKLGCHDYDSDDDCCHKDRKKRHGKKKRRRKKKCKDGYDSYDSDSSDSYDYYHSYDYGKKKKCDKKRRGKKCKCRDCKDDYDSCGYGKGKRYGSKKCCDSYGTDDCSCDSHSFDSCDSCDSHSFDSCDYDSCSVSKDCKCDHKKYKPDFHFNKSYAAFHYTKLCVRREDCNPLCAFKNVEICFVKKRGQRCVVFIVDGCVCWEIPCVGHRQPEQYSAIEYGGWPDIRSRKPFPDCVQVIFVTGKMLDAVMPANYNRSEGGMIKFSNRNNTGLLSQYPLDWYKNVWPDRCGVLPDADCETFCDNQSDCHENFDAALFGQGSKICIKGYKVFRIKCPKVCKEIVHDGKWCPKHKKCDCECFDKCDDHGKTGYGH